MIGAVAAIPAAYGVSDYLGARVSRDVPPTVVIVSGRFLVIPLLLIVAPLTGVPTGPSLLWGASAGIPLYLGFVWLYAALSLGAMAVAAPLIALAAAGVPLAVGVALGAPMPPLAWLGVVVAAGAVLLLNHDTGGGGAAPVVGRWRTAVLAVGAGGALGLFTVLTSRTDPGTGLWPLLAAQLVAWATAGVVMTQIPRVWPPVCLWPALAGAAVFELVGDAVALVAARHNLALVGPALALQPAVVIVLARLVDQERIGRVRAAGLGAALVALTLLTV